MIMTSESQKVRKSESLKARKSEVRSATYISDVVFSADTDNNLWIYLVYEAICAVLSTTGEGGGVPPLSAKEKNLLFFRLIFR